MFLRHSGDTFSDLQQLLSRAAVSPVFSLLPQTVWSPTKLPCPSGFFKMCSRMQKRTCPAMGSDSPSRGVHSGNHRLQPPKEVIEARGRNRDNSAAHRQHHLQYLNRSLSHTTPIPPPFQRKASETRKIPIPTLSPQYPHHHSPAARQHCMNRTPSRPACRAVRGKKG